MIFRRREKSRERNMIAKTLKQMASNYWFTFYSLQSRFQRVWTRFKWNIKPRKSLPDSPWLQAVPRMDDSGWKCQFFCGSATACSGLLLNEETRVRDLLLFSLFLFLLFFFLKKRIGLWGGYRGFQREMGAVVSKANSGSPWCVLTCRELFMHFTALLFIISTEPQGFLTQG